MPTSTSESESDAGDRGGDVNHVVLDLERRDAMRCFSGKRVK